MKFWIDTEDNEIQDEFEITEDDGDSVLSLHLAGMHEADAMGYSNYEDLFLVTEDGHTYPVVDPYKNPFWLNILEIEHADN